MSLPGGVNCGPNLKCLKAKGYMQIVSDKSEVLFTGLISHAIGKSDCYVETYSRMSGV